MEESQEIPELRDRLDTFRQLLESSDEASAALLDDMYSQCINETRERLNVLVDQYVDRPDILTVLMPVWDELSGIEELYQQQRTQGQHIDSLKKSLDSLNLLSPPPTTTASTSTSTTPATDISWPLLTLSELPTTVTSKTAAEGTPSPQAPQQEQAAAATAPTIKRPVVTEEKKEPLPDISCPICMDDVTGEQCHRIHACGHQYCLDCLDDYIEINIKDGKVLELKCPNPKCPALITYEEVGQILTSDETFAKYEEFLFLAALRAEPNLRWCPRPGCGNAVIGDPETPKLVCSKCHFQWCFKCNQDWHTGTCEQYEQWKTENSQEEKRFKEWQKEHTKACPKCKSAIEKNQGCNHMTCPHCHYQFCWLCGGAYTENHFSPLNVLGCPGKQFTKGDDLPQTGGKAMLAAAKRIGWRALVGTGIVVGVGLIAALALPVALIGAPIYGGVKLRQARIRRQRRRPSRFHY